MGWLELIPLLKRLLPLLSRMVPMLEAFVVARASNGKEAEARVDRVAADLKGDFKSEFASAAQNHAALTQTLAEHGEYLRVLNEDVHRLHLASGVHDARMEAVEAQLAGTVRQLKMFALFVILLLILCTALLVAMFLRH
jgi:hypothetical protein